MNFFRKGNTELDKRRIEFNVNKLSECFISRHNETMLDVSRFRECMNHTCNVSSKKFITENNGDECIICMNPLIGHCIEYACDCKCVLHENCLIKLVASGFTKCPLCQLELLKEYKKGNKTIFPYNKQKIKDLVHNIIQNTNNIDVERDFCKCIEKPHIEERRLRR